MFFQFKFWYFLTNPHQLANQLQTSSMRGFKKRVWMVCMIGVVLFALRDGWGMTTESITPILSTMTTTDYTIARYASLIGAIIWALLYFVFHFFGMSFILSLFTAIPFKQLLPMQLLMTGILLLEKAAIILVFMMKGVATHVSFLSLGPLAITFLDYSYFTLFLNQLTLTTVLIIVFQYRFICAYTGLHEGKRLLWLLLTLHIGMALVVAAVSFMPMENLFQMIAVGGIGDE